MDIRSAVKEMRKKADVLHMAADALESLIAVAGTPEIAARITKALPKRKYTKRAVKPKRTMTAAARKRLGASMRKVWARKRAAKATA